MRLSIGIRTIILGIVSLAITMSRLRTHFSGWAESPWDDWIVWEWRLPEIFLGLGDLLFGPALIGPLVLLAQGFRSLQNKIRTPGGLLWLAIAGIECGHWLWERHDRYLLATVYDSLWSIGFWYLKFVLPLAFASYWRLAQRTQQKVTAVYETDLAFLVGGCLSAKDLAEFLALTLNVREFVIW